MSDYPKNEQAALEAMPLFSGLDATAPAVKTGPVKTGPALRDAGMKRAEKHANEDWRKCAESALATVIGRGLDFTSEDVWQELEASYPQASTHDPRALGPVILAAIRANIVVRSGYVTSRRASRHSAPVAQYQVVRHGE